MSTLRLLVGTWKIGFLIAIVVVPMVWMLLDRSPPYEITGGVTVPPQIVRGQAYQIDWEIKNYPKTCDGTTFRFYQESSKKTHILLPVPAAFGLIPSDPQSEKMIVRGYERVMPKDTALGPIKFWGLNIHYCNFAQRFFEFPIKLEISPIYSTVVDPQ